MLLERTSGACDTPLYLTFHTIIRGRVAALHLRKHSSFWCSLALKGNFGGQLAVIRMNNNEKCIDVDISKVIVTSTFTVKHVEDFNSKIQA